MLEFILAPENLAFTVALAVMLGIALLEGTLTLLGLGLSGLLDDLIPESLQPDLDLEIGGDLDVDAGEVGAPSALSRLLGWMCVGRVPVLVLLVAFLTSFGLAGLFVQHTLQTVTGFLLPVWLAWVPALVLAMPFTRLIGRGLARIVPADETSAVSSETFIGRVATITLGTASPGNPAQARLTDQHGQSHYVMVQPDQAEESFNQGTSVLLVSREGVAFNAIRNTNPSLG